MRSLIVLTLLAVCGSASAHHSFAMYDPAQLIHIKGSVKTFAWTNPHVMVWVVRDEPAGELWTIELPTSPGNLARTGWSKHSLKAGDKVDVEVSPLRDGQHGGSFKKVTLVDSGEVLTAAIAANEPKDGGAAAAPPEPSPQTCADVPTGAAEAKQASAGCALASGYADGSTWLLALALVTQRLRRRK